MEYIKLVHVVCALSTGFLFVLRGYWMATDSPWFVARTARVLPHVIDSVLLASAIILLVGNRIRIMDHPWLVAKVTALVLYIGFGLLAFRFVKNTHWRLLCWVIAVVLLLHIYGFARYKTVLFYPLLSSAVG